MQTFVEYLVEQYVDDEDKKTRLATALSTVRKQAQSEAKMNAKAAEWARQRRASDPVSAAERTALAAKQHAERTAAANKHNANWSRLTPSQQQAAKDAYDTHVANSAVAQLKSKDK